MSADRSGGIPMGSVSAAEWVERAYEVLRSYTTATDPVGCEDTGYLVEFGIDYDLDDLVEEILERVDGRESLAVLLATAVLAVLQIRTEAAEDSDGCRLILPGAARGGVEDADPAAAEVMTPGKWLRVVVEWLGGCEDPLSRTVGWLQADLLAAFDDAADLAVLLASTLLSYTVERFNAAPSRWLHRQVGTSRPGVEVDAGMAPLIEAIWDAGIGTQFSCECLVDRRPSSDVENGSAMVLFATLDGAYRFLAGLSEVLWHEYRGYDLGRLSLTLTARAEGHPLMGGQRAVVEFPAADLELITGAWLSAVADDPGGEQEGRR
jgi:hypothetical protein